MDGGWGGDRMRQGETGGDPHHHHSPSYPAAHVQYECDAGRGQSNLQLICHMFAMGGGGHCVVNPSILRSVSGYEVAVKTRAHTDANAMS